MSVSIIGFDSAWTDNPRKPGAICAIRINGANEISFVPPIMASFADALCFIRDEQKRSAKCLVAIDQPTIVPNLTSMRPAERVVASVISFIGGGVQPANRSRIGMFDAAAPIWAFKVALGAVEDPAASRAAETGMFIIEVFPALALSGFEPAFYGRLKGPRYNPERKTFRIEDWHSVLHFVARYADQAGLLGVAAWAEQAALVTKPRKKDQDRLDAAICALLGHRWLTADRAASAMIGDLLTGYIIAPVRDETLARIKIAAAKSGVAVA